MREEYNQAGVDALANAGRPIPGQSLTNDPDQKYAWEGPPEFTEFRPALNFIADKLVRTIDIYKGVLPFVALQLIGIIIVFSSPNIATWLPEVLFESNISEVQLIVTDPQYIVENEENLDNFRNLFSVHTLERYNQALDNFKDLLK